MTALEMDTQDTELTVRLFGEEREFRLNRGVNLSLKLLRVKDSCEVVGFKDKYELREFEEIFNVILGYNNNFYDTQYLRTANEKQLNYTIKKQ